MPRGCAMWYILLLCPAAVLGFQDSILLSVDYFRERRVPFVCLVNCESDLHWCKEFAKLAANYSIAVSSFTTNSIGWHQDMEQCVLQTTANVGVVLKTSCGTIEDVLLTASENMWLDSQHLWLLMDENVANGTIYSNLTNSGASGDHELKAVEILGQLNISVNADVKIATKRDILKYSLSDVYNFGKVQGGALKVVDAGTWSSGSGFSSELNDCKFYRRWDFGQWPMRLMSVATVPPSTFNPSILTSLEAIPGVSTIMKTSTIILMVVAEVHNIKFVHTLADRWISTFEKRNSTIAGDSLHFREQDLTSVLRMASQHTYKISYLSIALTSLETRYYFRIPTTGPGKYENQFLRPLSAGAWRSTVGVAVLGMVILVATAKLEQRPSSVQYAVFSVIANICQQFFEDDVPVARIPSAARQLTLLIIGLSCVLIYNYYTSSVVSWLLNGPPPTITSLQELMESPLDLVYQDVGYTRSWFSNPGTWYYNKRNMEIEDKIRHKVLKKKKDTIYVPLEEGIAMVKAGGYAYHTETENADRLISRTFTQSELCELGSLKSMEKTLLYPGVQKNSPYKEFLSWSLTRLLERGIVSCVQRRTAARPVSCEGSSPRALALGGAAPAFIMLAFGFSAGTVIMFLERCIYKMKQKSRFS